MSEYIENEVKILDINADSICEKLKEIGAKKVFDDLRIITHYDYEDSSIASKSDQLKITEEGSTKISFDAKSEDGKIISIKSGISRKEELEKILGALGLQPISMVEARRISYESQGLDIDIDIYPEIQPFVEIDSDTVSDIDTMITTLGLEDHKKVRLSTPEIFQEKGLDYYQLFKI